MAGKQIWNCDESGFPIDPARCRVVSVKGQEAYKVTCGARSENVTTIAVCNPGEEEKPFLIPFAGCQTTDR